MDTPLYLVFILDKLIVGCFLLFQLTITFPNENIKPLVDFLNLKIVNPIGINVTIDLNLASNLMEKFIMQIMLYVPRACLDVIWIDSPSPMLLARFVWMFFDISIGNSPLFSFIVIGLVM